MAPNSESQSPDSQTFTLPNGRTLGYAIYGPLPSPSVPAIFYFHGIPGSRKEALLCTTLCASFSVTIIAIDRPGMGISTPQPGRKILDWPSDVLAIADYLKIAQFSVIGDSGGSPYALACAKAIPESRLLKTAVVSGFYPSSSLGVKGMLFPVRVMLFASAWLPTVAVAKVLDWECGNAARDPNPMVLEKAFMKTMEKRHEKDRKCLEDEEIRKVVIGSTREALRQGSEGAAVDLGLVVGEWGFGLEEVVGQRVVLWHGREDVNTPLGMAEKATGAMKGCEFHILDGETHLSLPLNRLEGILRDLVR
ncbi:hypothetical protein LSUE1_G004191 [Lachnellula suecica]|uniref:AB hydrolase-1 domain-containing protein n=1 Tax=Lachnellula suecica TaxID=602035 RepID=A0A8T9C4B6_9HELO|nr:hypothetical protein LSUE1_G004191 [Lachnellula suecica]